MAADESVYISIPFVVSPSWVRQLEELATFNRERLKLTIRMEGLEELCSSSRVCAQNHPFSLVVPDGLLVYELRENLIGAVEERFES